MCNAPATSIGKKPPLGERIFTYVMTEYRSLIVVLFALPLSMMWDFLLYLRWQWAAYTKVPVLHATRVERVVEQIKARPKGMRMCTGRPGWQCMSLSYRNYKSSMHQIDAVVDMIDIVSLDLKSETMSITVEPLVTTGQLTGALLHLGYTLPVVPEMDDLTVGGLVNGTGIESSSHLEGLFHEQCLAYEVCLADGTVVNATPDNEYSDLFHAIPWSYGTLGMLLSVKIRVVPCKKYVQVTYTPHRDRTAGVAHFAKLAGAGKAAPSFVEALAFSPTELVVMAGEMVDEAPTGVNHLGHWYKPWFYKHCESKLHDGKPSVEYIPLRDYYHRHTKSMFWEMELFLPVGNHPLARVLLGWLLPPKVSFLKLTQTEMTRKLVEETHIAQDFMLPMDRLEECIALSDDVFDKLYPLWLCPHVHRPMPGTIMPDPVRPGPDGSQMYVDLGVYGLPTCVKERPTCHGFDMIKSMRIFEAKMRQIKGVEMLYADIFCTKEEFESMYPHKGYRELRAKYGAVGAFPEVYDKINNPEKKAKAAVTKSK